MKQRKEKYTGHLRFFGFKGRPGKVLVFNGSSQVPSSENKLLLGKADY